MTERRMFRRVPFSIPLNYRELEGEADSGEAQLAQYGCSQDISFGGVRIKVPGQMEKGRLINLKIILPVTDYCKRVSVDSRVCWVNFLEEEKAYEMGVHFIAINQDTLGSIHEFIEDINNHFS
jgi:hypothetical protein